MIDSRDVIKRIEELEAERQGLVEARDEAAEGDEHMEAMLAITEFDEDDDLGGELKRLKALASDAEGDDAPDWVHGATLIRESHFVKYCQELCEDIGDLPKELPGYIVIDWEATARNLRQDYTEVEYGNVTYLVR